MHITDQFVLFVSGPLSQWHKTQFTLNGITFNCAEQYMMHAKALLFQDDEAAGKILKTSDQKKQKALGRTVRNFDPAIWNTHCRTIVYRGNYAKFSQNDALRAVLLTPEWRSKRFVEAAWYDPVWGIGLREDDPKAWDETTWQGTNWLGEALNAVRKDLLET